MGVYIRYANKMDADALALVYSQSYQAAFKGIIPDRILNDVFSYEKRKAGLQKELSEGLLTSVIMYEEDKPIGMLTYGGSKDQDLNPSCVEILRIYLLQSNWGRKTGEELMNWSLQELKLKGHEKISLWVIEDNLRARRFYERMGFVHDGVTRIIDVGKELKDYRYVKHI